MYLNYSNIMGKYEKYINMYIVNLKFVLKGLKMILMVLVFNFRFLTCIEKVRCVVMCL